ncbi:MAG: hypothetical protein IJS74_01460 [Clostridia bacterium]|nr:hypothetical protein [Clostridia bacterium]
MKNLKTKIVAILICICMCFSVLTGCSLFVKNTEKDNAKIALKIGDTVITKEELIEDYNRFYQQNSTYFMYYDTDTIMEIFYNSVIENKIIMIEAQKLVDDGTLVITDKDVQGVWDKVFDFVYGQVDSNEKAIYELAGKEENEYPERLKEEETSDEKAYKYEAYEFEAVEVKTETDSAYDPDNFDTDAEIVELKNYLLKYNTSKDEEEKTLVDIAEDELAVRNQAINEYIADLQFVAKSNKKDYAADKVLKAEVERVYKSYFDSMLYTKYQDYIKSTIAGVEGKYENKFSDSAIVEKYKKLLKASKESNTVDKSYIELVTSSSNDTLILYHNEDVEDTYFTVQHILVKFDDATLDTLKETAGYDVTKDAMFREYYEGVRSSIATDDFIKSMTASYRDENGYAVKEDDGTGKMVESKIAIGDASTDDTILGEYNSELTARLAALHATDEYAAMTADEKAATDQRVKTLLFQEFSWKYSEDTGSLVSDKLSGVMGFTINNKANENGSWVKEFAEGARELLANADNHDGTYNFGNEIKAVVSDYGVHLMMLTGVYNKGEVVSTTKEVTDDIVDKTDAEIVSELKNTYISNLTTESLYEYIYDLIKDELVGDSGTYFTDHKNALVKEYEDAKKIKYVNKMSNSELTDAIS